MKQIIISYVYTLAMLIIKKLNITKDSCFNSNMQYVCQHRRANFDGYETFSKKYDRFMSTKIERRCKKKQRITPVFGCVSFTQTPYNNSFICIFIFIYLLFNILTIRLFV